jgi:hypothetical protein
MLDCAVVTGVRSLKIHVTPRSSLSVGDQGRL